jgi:hypothetical protein
MNRRVGLLLFGFLLFFCCHAFGQASMETFGKNRIQYRRFEWKFYDAKHFKIYHYDRAGRELARYVAEQAEKDISAIESSAGGLFPDKLSIVLYNSFDDFEQSNIGLNSELQMQNSNPAGTVSIIGDKLVIYFTGKHTDLKKQLRQGMAQVVMEHLIFGENFREIVRNAVLLNLPDWITSGYVDYVVDGWTPKDDNQWKNIVTQNKSLFFNDLATENPRLAGKAFWKYIAFHYGENEVKNLLYLIQLKSNVNKAAKLAFHQKINTTFDSMMSFYQYRYHFERQLFEPLDTTDALAKIDIPDQETDIRNVMVSPRGVDLAYVAWKNGEYKVILERTRTENGEVKKEKSVILSGGVRNLTEYPDPDYPILAWSNTGFKLGIIFKNKNNIRIRVYNSVKAKIQDFQIPKNRFDRITGFTFMEDDENIVLSALRKGQSDLFALRLKGSRMTPITDDTWDDLAPVFVSGGSRKGIVFLSNRPAPFLNIKPLPNELPTGMMNAFFYNSTTGSYDLLPLTHNQQGTIRQVIPYGQDNFAYLSDQNGVANRYVVVFGRNKLNMDSAYSVPMTNYGRSIQYQQYNPASGKVADVIQYNKAMYVYFRNIVLPAPFGNAKPKQPLPLRYVDGIRKINSGNASSEKNAGKQTQGGQEKAGMEVPSGTVFQSEFSDHNAATSVDSAAVTPQNDSKKLAELLSVKTASDSSLLSPKSNYETTPPTIAVSSGLDLNGKEKRVLYVDSTFISMRSHKYYLSFSPDFLSLRLDNGIVFNRYQPYGQNSGQFNNPSLGGMLMARLFDKMEDYRFTGGIRIPANFSGLTYFLQFENFRRRTDWGLIFLREENKTTYNFIIDPSQPAFPTPGKTISNVLQGNVVYPLDKVKGLHLYLGLRQDKMMIKAQDPIGLLLPNVQDVWAMSRAEYTFDNSRNPALNIWNGFRYKFFAEYMYKLYSDNDAYSLGYDTSAFKAHGGFYNFGVDFRYYHKIYKNFIAAIRFAGAHSGGSQQIIYYLGGADNALNPKFSNAQQPSLKNDYAFQGLATNLRGYDQNARNGNTYALLNAELRLPVFATFIHKPIQSAFIKNFQAIAFIDVGSAWEGLLPTEENLTRNYVVNWPQVIDPRNQNPVVSVTIPNEQSNGLAIGYGAGLRTMLFGYFLRGDAAWNIDRQFRWYISIGTDF